MLLKELIDYLQAGELSQIFTGVDIPLRPELVKKLVLNINLGIVEIFRVLPLRKEEIIIQQYSHISNYILNSTYAFSNTASVVPYKYIMDSVSNPFTDNILKIINVYSEIGEELPINDSFNINSVFITNNTSITIPYPNDTKALSLVYLGYPALIPISEDIDLNTFIDIPYCIVGALEYFIASKLIGAISVNTGEYVNYSNKFLSTLKELELSDIVTKDNDSNLKLENMGWA